METRKQGLTKNVEDKADEPVVGGQREEDLVDEDDVLKVVDDALAVEKVHGGGQPVPVEALCGAQVAGAAGHAGDGNDLLERDDLDGRDDEDDVDVAHEEGGKEAADHDKGPKRPRHKVGLFLFILGDLLLLFLLGRLGFLGDVSDVRQRGGTGTPLR
jgi:hypothetical protein